ncbi:reverse transcriptase domain-containing protein, partial [Tanacetum coccineum]
TDKSKITRKQSKASKHGHENQKSTKPKLQKPKAFAKFPFITSPGTNLAIFENDEARDWLDKEPPRSIITWDDLVSKFINQYFPSSKTTYYRNKIITFYQKPNEAFNEAWERFKGLIRQCPHHGFSELHQLDTFYNSLNSNDQEDALDYAAGGNFLDKMPQEGLAIIESKSKVRYSRTASLEDKMTIKMKQMMNEMKALVVTTPAPVKAAPTPQIQGVSKTDFENYVKANDAVLKNVQNQGQNLQMQMANVTSLLTSLCNNFKNSASTSNSGTLPSQTVTNPRQQINAITTRSEEEESIFMEIPKPKAKKTVNLDLNSPNPNSFLKMFKQLRLEIGLKDDLVEMTKFNKWLSSLLRNKEKLEEIAIMTVNAECSAIIMNKVPEKLEDLGKFLIPCALQELNRTSALADSGASINLLPHSIYKKLELEALTPTRMTLELANRLITHLMGIAEDVVVRVDGFTFLADFVVFNFEPDPRVPIILGRPFLRTAKALIDLYEEKLTLRVGKEELVYFADKSEKNMEYRIFSSPVKTSDNLEKFADELTPLDSLPPGNDDSTLKKDFHEVNFQVYSNPLFEFDDNFKSSNMNPLFEENDKDVEIKSSSSFALTSPEESEFEAYLEIDSIPPGIDLTLPPTLEVLSNNPTSPTLTREKVCSWKTPMFFSLIRFVWKMMTQIAIRKKIICLLATYLHQQPKLLSRPQEVEEIKEEEDKVSSDIPIDTIVMPIRIIFDNPINFNDHFSKPKDFKKDLTVSFDSTESSILPSPLLDSDSPFTAELSASVTLNSLGNETKYSNWVY